MIKLLIVDDDRNVREFIKKIVESENENFTIVGEAENGRKGLKEVMISNPDIIILDLEMPLMDGLEMMKNLIAQKLYSKVLVLSCHDEFEYVKEAMQLGAYDYVLKHKMEPKSLLQVLNSLKVVISEQNDYNLNQSDNKGDISNHKSETHHDEKIENEKILIEIIREENLSNEEMKQKLARLGLYDSNYILISYKLDYYNRIVKGKGEFNKETISKNMLELISTTFVVNSNFVTAMLDKDYFLSIISFDKKKSNIFEVRKIVYDAVMNVQKQVRTKMNITISAGVSDLCTNIIALPEYWQQSKTALEYKFYRGTNKIIYFSEVVVTDNFTHINFKINELKASIQYREYAQSILYNLFSSIMESNISPEKFMGIFYVIMNIMTDYINHLKMDISDVFETHNFIYDALNEFETLEDYRIWFKNLYNRIITLNNCLMKKKFRSEILKAIEYIEANYTHEISQEKISEHVNMSKNYFSQIFKKETGDNFVIYLMKYRIEKAKEMLKQDDTKIYSIAYAVGFQNHHYFNNAFKKYVGMTPNQYRQDIYVK